MLSNHLASALLGDFSNISVLIITITIILFRHMKREIKLLFFIYLFIYNQIPPQSEENNILHKNSIDKILV